MRQSDYRTLPAGAVAVPLLSEQNRRKRNLVIIAAFLLLIGGASAFDLGIFAPELPVASNIVIFALFNLNLIVLLLLVLLLFRNLVKLWFERRAEGDRRRSSRPSWCWRFSCCRWRRPS